MDEVEAATASITQPNSEEDADGILNSVTLEHSAEQILNGIKREVEVQYLVPMMVASNEQDANQQSQQITQTDLECSFKESGEEMHYIFLVGLLYNALSLIESFFRLILFKADFFYKAEFFKQERDQSNL